MQNKQKTGPTITRFVTVAVLVMAVLMMAVPAGTAFAAPVAQASGPVAVTAACTTLQPAEATSMDAWINQDNITDNKNDSELRVKTESGKLNRSLIAFDLTTAVPTNAKVTSATLSLWVKDVKDGNATVRVHQVEDFWIEDAVTWRYQDKVSTDEWSNLGGDFSATILASRSFVDGVKDFWATFNVSAAAQSWAANPGTNYGVILESPVTNPKSEIKFKSSADGTASQRPKLEVCWDVGVGVTPDNLAQGTAGQNNVYAHTVTVKDFTNEPVGLSALSNQGWTTNIYKDVNGNGVKDAEDTAITQTPAMGPNGSYKILVEVVVPANAPNGTKDITTVTATGLNNGTVDTAKDTTLVGFPPVADPVLDGRRDLAYTQSLESNSQDYCDASGNVLARLMTLYDVATPDYVWVVLEMDLAHVDNSYGDNVHPSWGGDSHSLSSMDGSDKGQVILRDANGTVIFDVTADYVESNMSTVSGWGSAGVTDGEGSVAVGNASQVAVESSIGYNLNRFCTSSGSCTVNSVNLFQNSPPVNADYTPVNPAFTDWQYPYLYEFRFDASAFGSAGFGSATINNVHVSPNKTGSNEIPVTPCNGSIGDRVWQDNDGDKIQDGNENGLNGVMVNLYRDTGNGTFEPGSDLAVNTRFTAGDGDYDFTGLGPGVYFVDVVESTVPADYVLTTANEPLKVTLAKGQDYNDADFGYRTLPNVAISKTLITSDPAPVGSQVEFSIRITNTGNTAIDVLPLEDIFDPTVLQFVSATPVQSTVSSGVVRWNDLTTTQGNLAVGASTTVTVRFQALKNTTVVRRATLLAGTNVNAPVAEPVVDGLLESDYTFVGRSDPSGNAPGNLYKYTGASMCYYAFVVDRSYNDNVYASNDDPYLALDGWKAGGHKYSNLDGSDKAIFTVSGSAGTHSDLEVDYITKSGSSYTVDFFDAPINAAKTSLWYNLNMSGWNGNGTSPQYINGDVEYHSPPYNWNDAVGQYWEWHMIYEFSIPKASVGTDCGTVTLAGAHNSPSKDNDSLGLIGDYIWADLDAQGDQDPTEVGIPNVRVNLYQGNTLIRTTETEPGISGFYIFSNLPAGTYRVDVDESTLPAGYTLTTANEPKTVNLSAGQDYRLADFGYVPGQGSIGDRVYYDINGDGGLDNDNEPGINSVKVNLYQGVCPGSGTPFRTQSTTGNGDYLFTMLPAGTYCVNVDESTLPANHSLTTANEPKQVALAQDENYLLADFGYRVQEAGKTCDVATVTGAKDLYGTDPGDKSDFACVGVTVSTGLQIVKVRNGPDTVTVGDEVSYTIRLTNNGQGKLVTVPLQDTYDHTTLSFLGATPAPDDSADDGVLNWSDLTTSFGQDLDPNQSFDVVVRFRALKSTTTNVVRSAIASNAPNVAAQGAAPVGLQSPRQSEQVAWDIEIWPSASCSGWSIRFDRASGSADEQWRAKLDDVVFTSGTISLASGSKTLTGAWPTGVDLSTGSHTLRAEIYENGSWLYRTATFGPCATQAGSDMCYAVADGTTSAGDGSQKDTLASLNRLTGGTAAVAGSGIGNTNRYNIEAIAFKPGGTVLYAADGGQLGTLNLTTGLFTAIGSGFGTGNGSQGNNISFNDVDGLSFDPTTNVLYGTLRRDSGLDLLFQINPGTGLREANAFGAGIDYVPVSAVAGLEDVDDISVNPVNGVMYAILNNGSDTESRLVTINKSTGVATSVGTVTRSGSNIQDIEGLSFFNDGKLYGSSGKSGPTTNALYQINPATAVATLIGSFTNSLRDFEALACLTQSTASGTIGDRVYYDTNGDGGLDDDGEPGINNATVRLYGGTCSATPVAAIGVDRTTYGTVSGTDTFNLPHLTGTGVNRLMLVGVSINREFGSTNDQVDSIKYGTQSLTLVGTVNDTGSKEALTEIWALVNPTSGTANVTVTFNRANADGAVVGVTTFTGVDQTTPYGPFYSRSGNGTALSLVVPSASGELVFDTASVRSQGISGIGSGQAEQWRTYFNSRVGAGGSTKAGATNVTMAWTASGTTDWSMAAVSIKPASGPAAALATATTSGDGNYLFSNLAAGDYCVDVDGSTVPGTYNLTTANDPLSVNLATSSSSFLTADFGYKAPDLSQGTIGDRVWYDANLDAVQQLNEPGINGVTVKLYTGICPASGAAIQTAITTNNGTYLFSNLAAGNYCVDVEDATVPSGYLLTTANDPMTVNLPTNTSSFLDADFGYLASCPDGTPNVASTFGAKDEFNQTPEPVESYACVKITDRGAIGDFVWYDTNKDGIQDIGEPGIPNVTLDLYRDTDGTPGLNTATDTKVATTVTDADGGYLFTKVPPGTYFVDVTDTNGKLAGLTHTVLNQSLSDPTPAIVLPSGGVYKDADFGYVKDSDPGKALVGDTVWFDDNGDGVQQPSEPGIPNVTVTVYDKDRNPIGSADTDSNGRYLVQVPAGSGYTVFPDPADIPAGLTKTTPVPHLLPILNAGDQYLDADFGYNDAGTLLGAIGNLVFEDVDDDGLFNLAVDRPLAGVSVDLIRDTNNNDQWDTGEPVIATVTTDKSGGYLFTGVPAGEYLVSVSDTNAVLINYTKAKLGTPGVDNNNQVDPYAISLPAGGDNLTADFGYLKIDPLLGQIGNQVWTESDGNGLFDPTLQDVGQAGVTVDLYRNGTYYATTTTGASGDYSFVKLPSGTYTVAVSDNFGVLAGWVVTALGPNQSSDDNNQLQPYQIGLPTGGENLTADFGYIKRSSIGDYVWYDSNRDGIQDVGEPGIPNVTLDLYKDTDGIPGLDPATDTKIGTTVTDADGGYIFTDLGPGTYFVDVTDTNGKLTGLDHIVANQSQPDPTGPIVLTSGTVYKDADFAYVHPGDKAIVGDTVWIDANGDGVQQPSEPGLPGVTVTVYDSNNNPIGTADTDENGRYFISVDPGSGYTASPDPADIPAGLTTATTPVPHVLPTLAAGDVYLDADFGYNGQNLGTIGNLVWEDADNSGTVTGAEKGLAGVSVDLIRDTNNNKAWDAGEPIIATMTTDKDGGYLFTGLQADNYLVHVSDTNLRLTNYTKSKLGTPGANNNNQADPYAITLPAGGNNLTADFGYRKLDPKLGLIGNQVWTESDGNGLFDRTLKDVGLAGVTVDLFRNGDYHSTTTTGASGDYSFVNLPGGDYTVVVSDTFNVLSAWVVTTLGPNQGSDDNNQLQPYQILLPTGGENLTADFGYIREQGAIGDFVWYDADKDGIEDIDEPGIPNVTLDLYKDNGDGSFNSGTDIKVDSTVTDADGGYLFTGLQPGTYFVDVTDLNGKLTGLTHIVANQSLTDPTPAIVLPTGAVYKDADFGYVDTTAGKAIVGDTVWFDDNGDGVQQPNEPGLPNVTVTVYDSGGTPIGSADTDENGRYFISVNPGSGYTVSPNPADIPPGLTATTPVPHVLPTLSAGDQYLDADFGYNDGGGNLLGTIGNLVWEDKNDNGVFDSTTEAGLPGVSVDLIRDSNNNKIWDAGEPVIATVTTDKDGGYLFTGLPADDYLVHVSDTNAVLINFSKARLGTAGQNNNNQADPYAITLAAGADNLTADFAYSQIDPNLGLIGNQVWTETDGNGLFDPTLKDVGQAGVTVDLYRNGTLYATTTTGASGDYSFVKLPSGTYTVSVSDNFDVLIGWVVTTLGPNQGSDDNNQLQPYQINLPTGGKNLTADFGYIRPNSIGDYVWYDANRDGIENFNPNEPGIANVTLAAYQDMNGNNTLETNIDKLVATQVTDADGGYLFAGLGPGTYFVKVTDTNGKLTGLDHIVANQSQPDPTGPIVLTSGTVYKDADFGYAHPDTKAIVGDTVWYDYNGDGRQQRGEPGIPNVTVTVYDSGGAPIGTADTDENGHYFIEVDPGSGYTVSPDPADIPAGLTATTPVPHPLPSLAAGDKYLDADFGYDGANLGTIGNLVWEDVDNSGTVNGGELGIPSVSVDLIRDTNNNKAWDAGEPIIATITTDQDGGYLFTGVPAGNYLVHVSDTNAALLPFVKSNLGAAGVNNNNQVDPYAITLPAGGNNLTADFGYRKFDTKLGRIGNQVWIEYTDGIYNPADGDIDIGQPGVTVDLLKDGVFYARTTTGASGDYMFLNLPAGNYTVFVSDIYGVLNGYVVAPLGPNQGADNNNQQQPYTIDLPLGGENLTADFGYTLKGAIGDYVFYDSDKDGIQDVGEKGIGNVTVALYLDNGDASLNPAQDTLIGTATTDNDGGYLFTGLAQGVYFVDVTDTNGVLAGLTHTVGTQSQPDPSNPIDLKVGDVYRDADFGYVAPTGPDKAIIGDAVWYDGDGDGIQDPGEPGIPGITVCATPLGGGTPVCDVTDENGIYRVEVPAGTYTVAPQNPPSGYTATTPVPHGPVTVGEGDQYLDADFGYDKPGELGTISGTLWDDSPDKDGLLDGGEEPIPGVSVSLIQDTNGNGQRDPGEPIIATDTTDENGNYLFDGVPPGKYLVLPTDTQNVLDDFQPTKLGPNPGQDNNNQVRPYPVTLPAGGSNSTGDFGYVKINVLGRIGNQVWYEEDGNGIYNPDSGDKGIAGVTVELVVGNTVVATTTTGAGGDYVFTSLNADTYRVRVSDTAKVLEDYILTVLGPNPGSDNNNQAQAYEVVLAPASSNMTADFGYTRPSSIGDLVWYDADKDGIQDVDEPGIANVTVDLYRDKDGSGTITPADEKIASTVTDADGGYIFPGLVAGDYIVDVTDTNGKLTGMTQIVANQGQPDPTGKITIGAGEKYVDADFAYVEPTDPDKAIIGDTVWYDDNGDGIQQPNEPGIPGIQVCATPVGGGTPVCDTTDENGIYRLEVPAGTYTVQPTTPPAGFTATTPVPQGPVTVDAGEQYLDADFGYDDPGQNLLGTIGNLVFVEAKATRDGLYNGADKPLAGVSVDLIQDTNNNKVWDTGEPIIATVTTKGVVDAFGGNYLFTGLPAGNYLVHVSDTNAVLLDYKKTILGPNQGLDNNNQVDPYAITLGVGGDNLTADFGYYLTERPDVGVLGNQVWTESDADGLFNVNSGDVGQAGVTVELLKDGVPYRTTTTGPSGDYSFVGLPAGNYTTRVTDALNVLASYNVTTLGPNQGSDNNNQLQPYATVLPTGGVNLTGDFGYILPAAIGDFVYYDTDKDGIQDVGEPGIPNVAVDLYRDTNNNGVLNIGTDEKIKSTVTDADGGYLFRDLIPGKYIVDVTAASNPNGKLGTLDHTLGSQSATDPTPAITLMGGTVYKDADFGYVQPTTQGKALIGDTVWYDANGDGVQQPEEPGIPGITVRATDSNGNVFDGVTDETGTYRIEVPQGTYTVQPVNPPANLTLSTDPVWGPEILLAGEQRLDADFGYKDNNDVFGSIGNLVFWDKNRDGTYNSGDVPLGGVSVGLIRDTNGNGAWDAGEPIIATATTSTTVDANTGNYLFPAVVAGKYLVHVSDTNAVLFDFKKSVLGANQTADNTNKADPFAITLSVNQDNLTADFGYYRPDNQQDAGVIGNQIWIETDLDGRFDVLTKDKGQPGVTVDLYRGGVKVATTTSGASGDYSFVHLPSGTYTVAVSDNQNVLFGLDVTTLGPAQGSDNNNQLQPYTVVLPKDGINLTADFGYKDGTIPGQNKAAIGNSVWSDDNNNGLLDPGEKAIDSVVVKLWFDADNNCTLNTTSDVFVGSRTTAGTFGIGFENYLFEYPKGLRSGNYLVEVTDPNSRLVGATLTTGPTPGADGNSQSNPYCIQNFNPPGSADVSNLTADFGYLPAQASYMLSKRLTPPTVVNPQTGLPWVRANDVVSFTIRITNTGNAVLMSLPLTDTYDMEYLRFVSASPASVDVDNDGTINWTDLTATEGILNPGEGVEVIVRFVALKDTTDHGNDPNGVTINYATTSGIIADPDGNGPAPALPDPLPPQTDQDRLQIYNPTGVQIDDSTVTLMDEGVALSWRTVSEANLAGFYLLRTNSDGSVTTLNASLLLAQNPGQAAGTTYEWMDSGAVAGEMYTYSLEILRLDGGTDRYELGVVWPGNTIFLPVVGR